MKSNLSLLLFVSSTLLCTTANRAAVPVITDPAATSLGIIKGADPGEGLDLDGRFVYALSFGADPAQSWQVRDAKFMGLITDEVPGARLDALTTIPNWYHVEYGDSPDDDNLEAATSSIRFSTEAVVTLTLSNLKVGATYKLQLMFGEQCCNRGFNVLVDGAIIVKDFNPGVQQEGINIGNQEALITHTLVATKSTLEIKLDGPSASPDYIDHNAIFNALTVEEIATAGDSDGDGLADAWEQLYFKNLAQTASGDPDGDGLTNAEELAAGTDPTKADTDADGLTDFQEVKTYKTNPTNADTDNDGLTDQAEIATYKTNPLKADSDGDRLNDGTEVNIAKTDPNKADTDGDGVNDFDELRLMTDPTKKESVSRTTSLGAFTGADPGEGLDLQGKFIYAFSVGTENAAGQIGDANFTGETVDGVTIEQATAMIETFYVANFGDGANDTALARAVASIRHGGGGIKIRLDNLVVGASYKLQLLFGEGCCARGFDVWIDGHQKVDEFAPFVYQGGMNNQGLATNHAAVVTYSFIPNKTSIDIETVGGTVTTPGYSDHNPIINAVTLEEVAPKTDTDGDGLPDEWERFHFGSLSQNATGDPDSDGLTNLEEFNAGTDPNLADTDGDGLKDGEEVKTTKTDPTKVDSDGDGLSDGAEVTLYKLDPSNADTDGDGLPDGMEVITSGPLTKITNVVVQPFTGGDPGEGLDLQGNFRYAFNVSSAGAAGKAGDADFTADTAPGITVTAPSDLPRWDVPEYGDSAADGVIEKVTQSIRYGGTVQVLLSDLVPGSTYRLQLLFFEQCCAGRGFNIYVDGELLTADFSPPNTQGGVNNLAAGAVVAADIETQRDKMSIILTINGRTDPALTDPNAILDGLTLETLKQGPVQAKPTLTLTRAANGQVTITTDGTLQSADTVNGTYVNLPNKTITLDPQSGGQQKYYRGSR